MDPLLPGQAFSGSSSGFLHGGNDHDLPIYDVPFDESSDIGVSGGGGNIGSLQVSLEYPCHFCKKARVSNLSTFLYMSTK